MSKNRIPTPEEFARAKAAMADNDRGLDKVREQIKSKFGKQDVYEVFTFYSPKIDTFGVYIFYKFDKEIHEAKKSGLEDEIKRDVLQILEDVGRGNKNTIRVDFEFDSHENVEKNYEGDYFLRLR